MSPAVVVLESGVVVLGGENAEGPLRSVERWSTDAQTSFQLEGRLKVPRVGLTATRLSDDRVLVVGGGGSDPNARMTEILTEDPHIGMKFDTSGQVRVSRKYHTATLLPDGRVLVVGGRDSDEQPLASAEVWSPADGRWRPAGRLHVARCCHTASLLSDGRVLVAGGRISRCTAQEVVARRRTLLGKNDDAEDASFEIEQACFSAADNGELWDPKTSTFTPTAPFNADPFLDEHARRAAHTAVVLKDGRVAILGGTRDPHAGREEYGAFGDYLFDPRNGQWLEIPRGLGVAYHTSVGLPDGRVLTVGGAFPSFFCGKTLPPPPPPAGETPQQRREREAYEHSGGGDNQPYAWLWEPTTGRWSKAGLLAHGRSRHAAALLDDGRVVLIGGEVSEGPSDERETNTTELWKP